MIGKIVMRSFYWSGEAWREHDVGFYEGRPEELHDSYVKDMARSYSALAGKTIARSSHQDGILRLEFCDGTGCSILTSAQSPTSFIWAESK